MTLKNDGGDSNSGEDDLEGDENDIRRIVESTLVYNGPRTTNFCSLPVQKFKKSTECSGLLLSSPTQTFKRLFCDKVFNLIIKQTNIYGRQNNAKAGDMTRWTDITKSQSAKFIGINIIMRYCRNYSIDFYWSTDESLGNERILRQCRVTALKKSWEMGIWSITQLQRNRIN